MTLKQRILNEMVWTNQAKQIFDSLPSELKTLENFEHILLTIRNEELNQFWKEWLELEKSLAYDSSLDALEEMRGFRLKWQSAYDTTENSGAKTS
jgi:hypothetical protein